MTTPSNSGRIELAGNTLASYASCVDRIDELYDGQQVTLLTDLLADFMHYADSAGIDFQNCADVAYMHFTSEAEDARRKA